MLFIHKKMHSYYTQFRVNIWNENTTYTKFNQNTMKRIVDWYSYIVKDIPKYCQINISNIKFNYIRDEIQMFFITNNINEIKEHIGYFVDPDDDGNYPIEIDNEEYLVSGIEKDALESLIKIYKYFIKRYILIFYNRSIF